MDIVLANEAGFIGLIDGGLEMLALADEFAAHIDVAHIAGHGRAGNQAAFNQQMRIVAHDLAVLAGAGFRLVGIDDEIMRTLANHLGHEGPFEAGGEASAAAAAQAACLDLVHQPVTALVDEGLGIQPAAALLGALKAPVMEAVEIGENAILVSEHGSLSRFLLRRRFGRSRFLGGFLCHRLFGSNLIQQEPLGAGVAATTAADATTGASAGWRGRRWRRSIRLKVRLPL